MFRMISKKNIILPILVSLFSGLFFAIFIWCNADNNSNGKISSQYYDLVASVLLAHGTTVIFILIILPLIYRFMCEYVYNKNNLICRNSSYFQWSINFFIQVILFNLSFWIPLLITSFENGQRFYGSSSIGILIIILRILNYILITEFLIFIFIYPKQKLMIFIISEFGIMFYHYYIEQIFIFPKYFN